MTNFKLTNINLQLDAPIFKQNSLKILKLEAVDSNNLDHRIIKLAQAAQILNQSSLQWHQSVTLPAKFGKPFPFQVINKNTSFGYNPQDNDAAIEGQIVVNKSDGDYKGWEVTMANKRVGYLFANIQISSKLRAKKQAAKIQNNSSLFFGSTIEVKKDHFAITSIYANFSQLSKIEKIRIYIQFQLSGNVSRSAIKRLHQSEYRSYETVQLPATKTTNKLTAAAYIFDSNSNTTEKIGQGFTQLMLQAEQKSGQTSNLAQRVKIQRIFLYNDIMSEVGWISFKFLITKDECLDPKFFLQDHFNTIGDINFRPLKNNSLTISQAKGSVSLMSGLQPNNRIYVPKSQRFDDPAKRKACQKIGLGHQSLDLKQYPSTQTYKVAGIGFGSKIIAVERDQTIPGVGRYKLPLLFDRFK